MAKQPWERALEESLFEEDFLKDLDKTLSKPEEPEVSSFDPEGDGYDEVGARQAGLLRDEEGHLGSLDPNTGRLLKGINHESINKTRMVEDALGNEIVKKEDGYYSVPKKGSKVPSTKEGMEYLFGAPTEKKDIGEILAARPEKERGKTVAREGLKIVPNLALTTTEALGRAAEVGATPYTKKDLRRDLFTKPLIGGFVDDALHSEGDLLKPVRNAMINAARGVGNIQKAFVHALPLSKESREGFGDLGKTLKEKSIKLREGINEFIESDIEPIKASEKERALLDEPMNFENLFQVGDKEAFNHEIDKTSAKIAQAIVPFVASIGTTLATGRPYIGGSMLGILEGQEMGEQSEGFVKSDGTKVSAEEAQFFQLLTIGGNALLEGWALDQVANPILKLGKLGGKKYIIDLAEAIVAKGSKSKFINMFSGSTRQAAKNFVTEGGQEATQQIFTNAVEKYGYNEMQELLEGWAENAWIGGWMGFGGGGVTGGVAASKQKVFSKETIDEEARKVGIDPKSKEWQLLQDTVTVLMAAKAEKHRQNPEEIKRIMRQAVTTLASQAEQANDEAKMAEVEEFSKQQIEEYEAREVAASESLKKGGAKDGITQDFKNKLTPDKKRLRRDTEQLRIKQRVKQLDEKIAELDEKIAPRQEKSLAAGEPAGLEAGKPAYQNFFAEIKEKFGRVNNFETESGVKVSIPRGVLGKNGTVEFERTEQDNNVVWLDLIESTKRGKGNASKVLKDLIAAADKTGVEIRLVVDPKDKKGLSAKELTAWYKRHGFETNEAENYMSRMPEQAGEPVGLEVTKEKDFVFHSTNEDSFKSILKDGLKAGDFVHNFDEAGEEQEAEFDPTRKVVWFSNEQQNKWSSIGGFQFRVKRSALKKIKGELREAEGFEGEGVYLESDKDFTIPPEDLEYRIIDLENKVVKEWTPAKELAQRPTKTEEQDTAKKLGEKILERGEVGFHSGDMGTGIDTYLRNMGHGRSTGHFGTGVYFLSSQKKAADSFGKNRPIHQIDLEGKILFTPKKVSEAYKLHDALKSLNKLAHSERATKVLSDKEEGGDSARELNQIAFGLWIDAGGIKNFDSPEAMLPVIRKIIEGVQKDIGGKSILDAGNKDSASTRYMKEMGYQGVDVRHLSEDAEGLASPDNATLGSVIYTDTGVKKTKIEKSDAQLQKLQDQRDALVEEKNNFLAVTGEALEAPPLADMRISEKTFDKELARVEVRAYKEAVRAGLKSMRDIQHYIKQVARLHTGIQKTPVTSIEPQIAWQIKELKKKATDTKTAEELQAIYSEVKALYRESKNNVIFTQEIRGQEINDTAEGLTNILKANFTQKPIGTGANALEWLKKFADLNLIEMQRTLDVFDETGGKFNGRWHDEFYNNLQRGKNDQINNTQKYSKLAISIAEKAGLTQKRLSTPVMVGGVQFIMDDVVNMYAVRQNKDHVASLVFGNNIDVGMLREAFNLLSKKEKNAIDEIQKKVMDERFPASREVFIEMHDGTEDLIKVDRGYFPMALEGIISENFDEGLRADFRGRTIFKPHTLERQHISPEKRLPVRLGYFQQLLPYIASREHYIAIAPRIKRLRGILSNKELSTTMQKIPHIGYEGVKRLNEYLNTWDNNGFARGQSMMDHAVSAMKSDAAIYMLAVNLGVVMIQSSSIWSILGNNGVGFFDLIAAFGKSAGRAGVKGATAVGSLVTKGTTEDTYQPTTEEINKKSAFMRMRNMEREQYYIDAMKPGGWGEKLMKGAGQLGMWGIKEMDRITVEAGWLAVYNKEFQRHGIEAKAVQEADNVIARTQPIASLTDRPPILDEGAFKLMTSFMSYVGKLYGIVGHDGATRFKVGMRQLQESKGMDPEGWKNIRASAATYIGFSLMLYMTWCLRNLKMYPEDDDEMWALLGSPFLAGSVFGRVVSDSIGGYDSTVPAMDAPAQIGQIIRGGGSALDQIRKASEVAGFFTKIPVRGVLRTIEKGRDFHERLTRTESEKKNDAAKKINKQIQTAFDKKNKQRKTIYEIEKNKDLLEAWKAFEIWYTKTGRTTRPSFSLFDKKR